MAKRRYNSDDDDYSTSYEDSGKFSGQDRLFDKLESDDDSSRDHELDTEQLDHEEKSEAYDDNFDFEKAKEQKKKKRIANIKPKLIGKHSLAYDTILKGKRPDKDAENGETEHIIPNIGGSFDLNEDSSEFNESRNSIENHINIKLQQEIYDLLKNNSDINFLAPRRKPSADDFNSYFSLALEKLEDYGFSRCDIFIELSGYFSDNTYSIYKLLKAEYMNSIISELKQKFGLSDMDKIDFLM